MLSPPWVESQGLSTESGSIKEIELPEDNARAMRFICAVIHHQNDEEIVKRAPSTRAFLHIAILTDKYDFHRALKFFLKSIMRDASLQSPLQDWTPRTELRDMGLSTASLEKSQLLTWTGLFNLTAAAYLLDDCTSFSKFSFDLMAILPYSFAALLHDDRISSLLPPKFAGKFCTPTTYSPTATYVKPFLNIGSYVGRTSLTIPIECHQGHTKAPEQKQPI